MPERPPCELCGDALYRPSDVRRCACGGEHDLCVICVVRNSLWDQRSVLNDGDYPLAVCPDQVRVARVLMGRRATGKFSW